MAEQLANNVFSFLAASINDSVTSITVSDGSTFPASGNFRIRINSEIMIVTARSSNTLTVTRGAESTIASSHTVGDRVAVVLTAGGLADYVSENGSAEFYTTELQNIPSSASDGAIWKQIDGPYEAYWANSQWNYTFMGFPVNIPAQELTSFDIVPQDRNFLYQEVGGTICVYGFAQSSGTRIKPFLVSKSSPYCMTMGFAYNGDVGVSGAVGPMIYESSSTKSYTVILVENRGLYINYWSNLSTFGATRTTYNEMPNGWPIVWVRVINNGTIRYFQRSPDKVNWVTFLVQAAGTDLTEDYIGFSLYNTNNDPVTINIFDFEIKDYVLEIPVIGAVVSDDSALLGIRANQGTAYHFQQSSDGVTWTDLTSVATRPYHVVSSLSGSTTYYFRGRYYVNGAWSSWSKPISRTTLSALMLDAESNIRGTYSFRLLRSAYAGNCIKVRRASDDATLDVGFANNFVDLDSMFTWSGTDQVFIETWYDQSTNGLNVGNATTTFQPELVDVDGMLHVNENGLVGMKCNTGGNTLYLYNGAMGYATNHEMCMFAVASGDGVVMGCGNGVSAGGNSVLGSYALQTYFGGWSRGDATWIRDAITGDVKSATRLRSKITSFANTLTYCWNNNVDIVPSGAAGGFSNGTASLVIGKRHYLYNWDSHTGYIQEALLFDTYDLATRDSRNQKIMQAYGLI